MESDRVLTYAKNQIDDARWCRERKVWWSCSCKVNLNLLEAEALKVLEEDISQTNLEMVYRWQGLLGVAKKV